MHHGILWKRDGTVIDQYERLPLQQGDMTLSGINDAGYFIGYVTNSQLNSSVAIVFDGEYIHTLTDNLKDGAVAERAYAINGNGDILVHILNKDMTGMPVSRDVAIMSLP